jgi:hypothetical protein
MLQFELEACDVVAVIQNLVFFELLECDVVSPHVIVCRLVYEMLLYQIGVRITKSRVAIQNISDFREKLGHVLHYIIQIVLVL